MMDEEVHALITVAALEYEKYGIITVSTIAALAAEGILVKDLNMEIQ